LCVQDDLLGPKFEQFESEICGDVDSSGCDSDNEDPHTCNSHREPTTEVPSMIGNAASDNFQSRLRPWQLKRRQQNRSPELQPEKKVQTTRMQQPTGSPTNAKGAPAGAVPKATFTGILLCVHAFLVSIPVVDNILANYNDKFQGIFQKITLTGLCGTEGGDGSRSQIKAQYFPKPERQEKESDE
jgi:hypothetical protein